MANATLISWTDHTFNPWMGCTRVSEGCRNCYAETLTKNRMGLDLWGPDALRQATKSPWTNVRKWQVEASGGTPGHYGFASLDAQTPQSISAPNSNPFTPHLVFTGSLMDWAEDRDDLLPLRERMWDVIRRSPNLWFQMLTKRPEKLERFLPSDWGPDGYRNVWLGTTIEDSRVAERARHLTAVPARVHFISYEPTIGPLDEVHLDGIEWVICGGESGSGYRPLDMRWALDMRNRCFERRIAFFMKQGSAFRAANNPWLIEADGSRWAWKQYPGKLTPPLEITENPSIQRPTRNLAHRA